MKKTLYIAAALLGTAALTSCDDDFARPPLVLAETLDLEANMSIEDFKTRYWSTIKSGPATIGLTDEGDSIILTGRVCSSDESGNIYKNIIIQTLDNEGDQVALTFSVNRYDIYELFPFGQEVVIKATGLHIGPYSNLLEFGAISGSQMTFMDEDEFTSHVFRNSHPLPEPAKVDTTVATLAELTAAKANESDLMKWQSRLIRVNDVHFVDAGKPFAGTQTSDRYITDADGNRLNVRNSSYADFSMDTLPYGNGSVVGILSYYSSNWQLLLIDESGCIGFDNIAPDPGETAAPAGEGTAASPYNVAKALEVTNALAADTESEEVYVEGIISAVSEISTSYGNATYTITDENGSDTFSVYRGYWLGGEKFTSESQLAVGAKVVVKGKLVNYKGNTPQLAQGSQLVSYNGQTAGGDTPSGGTTDTPTGDGTLDSPYNAAKALEVASALSESDEKTDVYVSGVVASITELSTSYGNATYTISDQGGSTTFSIYRGYGLNGDKFTSEDQLKVGATVIVKGTIVNYKGNTPQLTTGSQIVNYNGQTASTQQINK